MDDKEDETTSPPPLVPRAPSGKQRLLHKDDIRPPRGKVDAGAKFLDVCGVCARHQLLENDNEEEMTSPPPSGPARSVSHEAARPPRD